MRRTRNTFTRAFVRAIGYGLGAAALGLLLHGQGSWYR